MGGEMSAITGYRDLDVWQRAMELVECCYRATEKFPRSEEFGLRAQIRRAAVSIPSNIAEGQGRSSTGEYVHHLSIAHGSLMELETQVQIAGRLGFLISKEVEPLLGLSAAVGRMLNALTTSLRRRASAPRAPRSPIPDPRSLRR
jgi:four helix bundle protein